MRRENGEKPSERNIHLKGDLSRLASGLASGLGEVREDRQGSCFPLESVTRADRVVRTDWGGRGFLIRFSSAVDIS